jgi:hypothetical protein
MKTSLIIVASAAVTLLLPSFINGAKTGYERTWLICAVKVPGSMAIEAIQCDLSAGRCESAGAKVDALAQTWKRFNSVQSHFEAQASETLWLPSLL